MEYLLLCGVFMLGTVAKHMIVWGAKNILCFAQSSTLYAKWSLTYFSENFYMVHVQMYMYCRAVFSCQKQFCINFALVLHC